MTSPFNFLTVTGGGNNEDTITGNPNLVKNSTKPHKVYWTPRPECSFISGVASSKRGLLHSS